MNHPVFLSLMTSKAILKFRARKPTLIGLVAGFKFYEDPICGDEAALIAVSPSGKTVGRTHFWELPSRDEVMGY